MMTHLTAVIGTFVYVWG